MNLYICRYVHIDIEKAHGERLIKFKVHLCSSLPEIWDKMAAAHASKLLRKNKMAAGFYKKMYRKNNVFSNYSF